MAHYFKDGQDISSVDVTSEGKPIRNRWQWTWLSEVSDDGHAFGDWCKKISQAGVCFCTVCGKSIVYGSSGKKALRKHANLEDHVKAMRSVDNTTRLHGATTTTSVTKDSLADQCCEVKAIISMFIAEHCLSYSLAPELLKLSQRLSQNTTSLNNTTISRQTAMYISSHGVGVTIRDELKNKLKDQFFSLNIDEATNNANNKFVNIIVQFYDEDDQQVRSQLLGTREVNVATADNILEAIKDVLDKMELSMKQVISITMDNCNVMRGKKGGVETKVREMNTNLLDVSGDTIHMVNNAVKKFFVPVDKFFDFQSLASDLFYDVEESPKVRSIFGKIQSILTRSDPLSIIRPIPNRFLQMNTVATRTLKLWDCLIIYYSAFLTSEERKQRRNQVEAILTQHEVSENDKREVRQLLESQRKQSKSEVSSDRKCRILNALFDHEERTRLVITLYQGITEQLMPYTKKYQSAKPQLHELHEDMFRLTKEFFAGFILSDKIPALSTTKLVSLDLSDRSLQLKDRDLCVGKYSRPVLSKALKDSRKNFWLSEFFTALRLGYIAAGESLKKLPLTNKVFSQLAFLSPALQRNSKTSQAITALAERLPNVIPPSEIGLVETESRAYTVDEVLAAIPIDESDSMFRLDKDWWNTAFERKFNNSAKYPTLTKLVKAALSIFTGPIVESSFNIMDDIIEDDRTRLTTFNYESLAMTKSSLTAHEQTALTKTVTARMKINVAQSYANYQRYLKESKGSHNLTESTLTSSQPATSTKTKTTGVITSPLPAETTLHIRNQQSESERVSIGKRTCQAPIMNFFSKKPRLG